MLTLKRKQHLFKLKHWEYWPMWIYYLPVWIQHFWLSTKVGNLFFFLKTNPAIDGFILSDSKYRTLHLVPHEFKPKTIFVDKDDKYESIKTRMEASNISFPIILKPDIGFRGLKVLKLDNENDLYKAINGLKVNSIIQEYIASELEIGLFYYRYPDEEKGFIPSLTIKKFLSVIGNGVNTLRELVEQDERAMLHHSKLEIKFKKQWDLVLPLNKKLILEHIGNHNKGTEFRNGNHLIDDDLVSVFDELSHRMKGFYFGRFDIRTTSLEILKKDKKFKILEVNGVGGEPTHIYDPKTPFFDAWKDLCSVWRVAAKIAKYNFKNGERKPSLKEGYSKWKAYSQYKEKLI